MNNSQEITMQERQVADLLSKDFEYITKSLGQQELLGEKRVTFYMKSVVVVMATLFAVFIIHDGILSTLLVQVLVFSFYLFVLLTIGTIIFLCSVKQYEAMFHYESALDQIRNLMKINYKLEAHPSIEVFQQLAYTKEFKANGALYVIAAVNSFVATLFFNLILFSSIDFFLMELNFFLLLNFLTSLSLFLFHCSYIKMKDKNKKCRDNVVFEKKKELKKINHLLTNYLYKLWSFEELFALPKL